jgi:peptide/nickel transport system permease protein
MIVAYLIKRVFYALVVLFMVSVVTFSIIHLAPGGPSLLADPKLSKPEIAQIERELGIDKPIPVQFALWLTQILRGDLGKSFLYQTGNLETIMTRLPNTLILAGVSLLISVLIAVPLGLYSAIRPYGALDQSLGVLSLISISIPVFWLGLLLIILFAVTLRILPAGGMASPGLEDSLVDRVQHLILPVFVLSTAGIAEIMRYTRSSARNVLRQDFVRTARAKGLSEGTLQRRHVLRNALIPVVTIIGLQLPRLVGGAAVTETIFSWPGMGRLGVEAALSRDYPLILAITLFVAVAVVAFNLIVDLIYPLLDPRIGLE